MRRGGFTFIEVMAVVALLGLLAAATAFSLADSVHRSTRQRAAGQIIHADRSGRSAVRQHGGGCTVRFDLETQTIVRIAADEHGREVATHSLKLSEPHRIDRMIVPRRLVNGSDGEGDGDIAVIESGQVRITYDAGGRSATFAVRLVSPGESAWLLFAGLTGQFTWIHDDKEIDNLFAVLATGRPDAD